MSKRMTATDKWKKPFIKSLPLEYKIFWLYLLDDCDHAGLWYADFEVAELRLGTKLSQKKAEGLFAEKVVLLDNGAKWFIPDFITFQYGEFNEANKMYKAIIPVLKKYNLIPHLSPIYGVKVKEQVMVTVLEDKKKSDFFKNQMWKEQFAMNNRFSIVQVEELQKKFINDCDLRGEFVDSYQKYFINSWNKGMITVKDLKVEPVRQIHV